MNALAETRGVTRRFGTFTAVDSVSLAVEGGETVGLLGANGAGKTTLIRLLLGLLPPTSGEALLFGSAPSVRSRRRVGYVPQTLGLYDDMTVKENWDFTSRAFGLQRMPLPEDLGEIRNDLVGTLSLGTQRQVAFAVAMSHKPELLVLDEPTSGVAPLSRARLWQDIHAGAEAGAGVLVTTHNMEEAEQCDRLVVMADGQMMVGGTAADVIGSRTVAEVRSKDWRRTFELLDNSGLVIQAHGDVLRVPASKNVIDEALASEGVEVSTALVRANLEEAFVMIISEKSAT
ncbi:MAG: ABC transporter ATP-binding protein [Actinomycetota bacterium]|nr:MAG: ABC transporter ATP-binding protein [Actinomycetota bacterium]